jgi:hypothetical protein
MNGCIHCGSTDLQTSGVRRSDLPSVLLLKLPFRCRSCKGRTYLSIVEMFRIWLARKPEEKADGR